MIVYHCDDPFSGGSGHCYGYQYNEIKTTAEFVSELDSVETWPAACALQRIERLDVSPRTSPPLSEIKIFVS